SRTSRRPRCTWRSRPDHRPTRRSRARARVSSAGRPLNASYQRFLALPFTGHDSCTFPGVTATTPPTEDLMWNKDGMRGKSDQVKGRVKESIGNLSDDDRLREEGQADQAAGEVEEAIGKGRRKLGNAIKDVGNAIKR